MKTDLDQHNKHMDLTHGPDSTITDPTFSSPFSVTSLHSAENSALQPWKFSNSNSTTWMTHGAGSQEEEEGGGDSKPAASPAVTSLPGYLVRGTGSTLALPSSQLLRGALLLRHPPDPPLLHFVAAAHTQTEHHPSGVHGWSTDRRTQEEETQCHSAVSNSPLNKRIVLMLL